MVLPNMMAEAGVKNAYLPPDDAVFDWLAGRVAARTGQPAGRMPERSRGRRALPG